MREDTIQIRRKKERIMKKKLKRNLKVKVINKRQSKYKIDILEVSKRKPML